MGGIGSIATKEAQRSFATELPRPAAPISRTSSAAMTAHRSPLTTVSDRLARFVEEDFADTVRSATRAIDRARTPATLAGLAQALESIGDVQGASAAAIEALSLARDLARQGIPDVTTTRLATEVLLRSVDTDVALLHLRDVPLTGLVRLQIAGALASNGKLAEAKSYLNDDDEDGNAMRYAIRGYIYLLEGRSQDAVGQLRRALRIAPYDANSALNLSIALSDLGSYRKALNAAKQARLASPGREDIVLHFLDLMMLSGDTDAAREELRNAQSSLFGDSARMLVVHARLSLMENRRDQALQYLSRAARRAEDGGDIETLLEVKSNAVRLRGADPELAFEELREMHRAFPSSDVVVANLAQLAWLKKHADPLDAAFADVASHTHPARVAFIKYQVATLRGDNVEAARFARKWLNLEPRNPSAITAALIAVGIGEESWGEAAEIVDRSRSIIANDSTGANNAAYVLAMAGRAQEAVDLISPFAEDSFVCKATLGLAYLALNEIDKGMRLYRQAADSVEKFDSDTRSLMTAYQALIVQQLGLSDYDRQMIHALSLPPYPVPDDWADRPEFLRLHTVAERNGYRWPSVLS